MRLALTAILSAAVVGLAACTTVTTSQSPASSTPSASSSPKSASAGTSAPSRSTAGPATTTPAGTGPAQQVAPTGPPATNVTDPWAVVSAYYGDIESGAFAQAWALLNSGATTGQTYQQFVNGFACTGSQTVSEVGQSGDQVTFDLDATNSCTGQVQQFTGTDTVQNGMIVAANVVQTG
jgi:hypothetical protein